MTFETRRLVRREYQLYLFVIPALIVVFLFNYLPLFSNVIAFMDYDFAAGWMGLESEWVGFMWFAQILSDPLFWQLLLRTLFYSVVIIIVGFPAPIILALLLNEVRIQAFKRVVQSITYVPRFVSWVVIASLAYLFLSTDATGIYNNILELFGLPRRTVMGDASNFWIVLGVTHVYKSAGWGSIIYLAAISALDPQLYEAAEIDGAGRWKQFLHVTFPGILPTTMILLVLTIGGLFSTSFDQVLNLQNPIIRADTNTINVYTFYAGVRGGQYSVATAVGLFQGAINAVALVTANILGKKLTSYGLY